MKPETGFLPDGSMLIWDEKKRRRTYTGDYEGREAGCAARQLLDLIEAFADDAREIAVKDYASF